MMALLAVPASLAAAGVAALWLGRRPDAEV